VSEALVDVVIGMLGWKKVKLGLALISDDQMPRVDEGVVIGARTAPCASRQLAFPAGAVAMAEGSGFALVSIHASRWARCHASRGARVPNLDVVQGPRYSSAARHVAPGTWHLAPGTWHLALGTWHLAPGT
jgi:hypothetical protein